MKFDSRPANAFGQAGLAVNNPRHSKSGESHAVP
jgi:hypothetical protein